MLTAKDICKRLDLDLDQVGFMYAKRVLPDGITIDGTVYFREQDIRAFERWLKRRLKCRAKGIDPDGPQGPAPPVYSTAGKARFDPRLVAENEREAARQSKSRTLRAGTKPIVPERPVTLPEPKTKVEG